MQGPHQVAQKSTTTTLPLNVSSVALPPWRSASSKAGAGREAAPRGGWQATTPAMPAAVARAISVKNGGLRILTIIRLPGRLPDPRQGREPAREQARQRGELVREEQHAHADEERAGGVLDHAHVLAQPRRGGQEPVDGQP